MSFLACCDVLASIRYSDDRDIIVVTSEELLSTRNNVSNNNGGAQGEDHVFVVWMKDESFCYLACRNKLKLR